MDIILAVLGSLGFIGAYLYAKKNNLESSSYMTIALISTVLAVWQIINGIINATRGESFLKFAGYNAATGIGLILIEVILLVALKLVIKKESNEEESIETERK